MKTDKMNKAFPTAKCLMSLNDVSSPFLHQTFSGTDRNKIVCKQSKSLLYSKKCFVDILMLCLSFLTLFFYVFLAAQHQRDDHDDVQKESLPP